MVRDYYDTVGDSCQFNYHTGMTLGDGDSFTLGGCTDGISFIQVKDSRGRVLLQEYRLQLECRRASEGVKLVRILEGCGGFTRAGLVPLERA